MVGQIKYVVFYVMLIFFGELSITTSKKCDRCDCNMATIFPTSPSVKQSILIINCSDSIINNYLRLPDTETYGDYRYTEIHAEFQRNKIGDIEIFDFKDLTRLNLAHNEIRKIADNSFTKLKTLKVLDLSYNKINVLESNAFKNLKNLERLILYDTKIQKLEGGVFGELQSLKELDLGHNYLEGELEGDHFSFLNNLEVLSLKENSLTNINIDSFTNLRLLKQLDLSGNSLQKIDNDILLTLKELNILNLSKNKLSTLEEGVFKRLNKLTVLDLSHNGFKRLDKGLEIAKSLRVLNVGYNQLTELEFVGQELEELEELHAEHNVLDSVEFVKVFTKIQVLNISTNQLSEFPIQQYPKLRVLDLSNNTFQSVPLLLTGQYLPSLSHLRLDMNPISVLQFPVTSYGFNNLSYVSVSHMDDLKEVVSTAFASLRGKDPARRENLEQAVEDKDGGVMKRQVQQDSSDEVLNEDGANQAEDSKDHIKEPQEKESLEDTQKTEDKDIDNAEEDIEDKVSEASSSRITPLNVNIPPDEIKQSPDIQKLTEIHEDSDEENEDKIIITVSKETNTDIANEPDSDRTVDVRAIEVGNLRSEPMNVKEEEVETNEGRSANEDQEKSKVKQVECTGSRLVLKISNNKNLMSIQEDTFKGIDICMLDLSYNSLSTVPETMVNWEAVPSIDLQGNPWDCSCKKQWLLDIIVPKVYDRQPQLLYELRCGSPPMLRDRRFVHFYNWTEPAFCTEHKEKMRTSPVDGQEDTVIDLKLSGSSEMLVIVGVACGVVVLLVGVGVYLQRRLTLKRRNRNRRK